MPTKLPNMKRWSDQKLGQEHAFAILATDANDPANQAWVAAVKYEVARRNQQQSAIN